MRFAPVPEWLMRRNDVPTGAKLVFALILQRENTRAPDAPNVNALARELGMPVRTFKRHVATARARGILEVESNQAACKANGYRTIWPPSEPRAKLAPGGDPPGAKSGQNPGPKVVETRGQIGPTSSEIRKTQDIPLAGVGADGVRKAGGEGAELSDHRAVLAAHSTRFEASRGRPFIVNARTAKAAKDLLDAVKGDRAEAESIIANAWADPWFRENQGELWFIANSPNRYRGTVARSGATSREIKQEAPPEGPRWKPNRVTA